jgi:division protein CdvB (Snf7/Vps24/ESCRT-III family)
MALQERISKLEERETKLFEQRDEAERKIEQITGRLSPSQFLQIRQLIEEFEACEKAIERVQETLTDLAQAI